MVVCITIIPWLFSWEEGVLFYYLAVSSLFFLRILLGLLILGVLVSAIQSSVFEECMETNCSPKYLPIYVLIGGFMRLKILWESLCSRVCWLFWNQRSSDLVQFLFFSKYTYLMQLQAFKNCALSFFQLVLRSQKFNPKMVQSFSFPLFIRYDSLVQSQARELYLQRQQIKDSCGICVIYRQHMNTMIKAFEELLQASDVDHCVAEGFQEQLNQCAELLEKLEKLFLSGKWGEGMWVLRHVSTWARTSWRGSGGAGLLALLNPLPLCSHEVTAEPYRLLLPSSDCFHAAGGLYCSRFGVRVAASGARCEACEWATPQHLPPRCLFLWIF